ncbi:MAG: hypothetical protein WAW61_12745 [Methylococcaceae bacterium]
MNSSIQSNKTKHKVAKAVLYINEQFVMRISKDYPSMDEQLEDWRSAHSGINPAHIIVLGSTADSQTC